MNDGIKKKKDLIKTSLLMFNNRAIGLYIGTEVLIMELVVLHR
ncbi:MAG: hypothetical protein ACI8RD_006502 [Bacillariaceae sp.]|jgi:hypothetical protein